MSANTPLENPLVEARIVYCHLREPDRFGKYSCLLVIDKDDPMVKKIVTEIDRLCKVTFGGKRPAARGLPIKEAAEQFGEDYSDCYVIRCSSGDPVDLFNSDKTPILADNTFPGGTNVRALLAFTAYQNEYGKFVGCFINGVQYVSKGDPIGRAKPDAAGFFSEIEGTEPASGAADNADPSADPAAFFK